MLRSSCRLSFKGLAAVQALVRSASQPGARPGIEKKTAFKLCYYAYNESSWKSRMWLQCCLWRWEWLHRVRLGSAFCSDTEGLPQLKMQACCRSMSQSVYHVLLTRPFKTWLTISHQQRRNALTFVVAPRPLCGLHFGLLLIVGFVWMTNQIMKAAGT